MSDATTKISSLQPGPEVIKLFSCSVTFISRINYCLMGFMPEFSTDLGYFSIFSTDLGYFSIDELLKFHAQLS